MFREKGTERKMTKILLAGGSGSLGKHVLSELKERGYWIRTISRMSNQLINKYADDPVLADLTNRESLRGICSGVDMVLSCAGASMNLSDFGNRQSFTSVDYEGNLRLLKETECSGVKKFAYVSLFAGDNLRFTEYAGAHERFVDALKESSLESVVIRPTGFFSIFEEILKSAQWGIGFMIGEGNSRTNPIHQQDVAAVCAEALESGEPEIEAGGPVIYTRREIVELAFKVLGREPKIRELSENLFKRLILPLRVINPRLHALMDFGIAVSRTDIVAPAKGKRTLEEYFKQLLISENKFYNFFKIFP
jgi:uncharacterized protein YbjT (DUF2867 family)